MANALFTTDALAHNAIMGAQQTRSGESRDAREQRLNAARDFVAEHSQNAMDVASILVEAQRPAVSRLMEVDTWQLTGSQVYSDAVGFMASMLKTVDASAKLGARVRQHAATYIGTASLEMDHIEQLAQILAIASETMQRTEEQTQRRDYRASNAIATVERYIMQFALARAAEAEYLPQLQAIYGIEFDVRVVTERDTTGRENPVDCVPLDRPAFSWPAAMNAAFVQVWEARQSRRTLDELSDEARRMLGMQERETGAVMPVHLRGIDTPAGEVSGLAADLEAQQ